MRTRSFALLEASRGKSSSPDAMLALEGQPQFDAASIEWPKARKERTYDGTIHEVGVARVAVGMSNLDDWSAHAPLPSFTA